MLVRRKAIDARRREARNHLVGESILGRGGDPACGLRNLEQVAETVPTPRTQSSLKKNSAVVSPASQASLPAGGAVEAGRPVERRDRRDARLHDAIGGTLPGHDSAVMDPNLEKPPTGNSQVARALRRDEICDRFEAAWQSGARPRIEDFLGRVGDDEAEPLLGDLLAIEIERRRRLGECAGEEEYRGRFPQYAPVVAERFRFSGTAGNGSLDETTDLGHPRPADAAPAGSVHSQATTLSFTPERSAYSGPAVSHRASPCQGRTRPGVGGLGRGTASRGGVQGIARSLRRRRRLRAGSCARRK